MRIHIGPLKTGSTTIQHMLEAGRERMLAAGFLYPETAKEDAGHLEAVLDLAATSNRPTPWRERFVVEYSEHQPPRRQGTWQNLREAVRQHQGSSVISHEVLCFLPTASAAEFLDQLGADRAEVLMVQRRPSDLVPSLYLERIKAQHEVSFASFASRLFAELPFPGASEHEFIDIRRLTANWTDAGAEVVVIEAGQGLSDSTVVDVCEALTPGLAWVAPQQASNVAMSAHGAELWRAHCSAHPPAFMASAHAVRKRMLKAFPQTASGPRLRLSPEAATALDSYCYGQTDTVTPVTQMTVPVPSLPFDQTKALRRMARWQHLEDIKWKVLDLASAATGRGHLMPGLFAADDPLESLTSTSRWSP